MLLSYNRPAITWTLAGDGAAWLTESDVLTNGRPAAAARLQWLSGAQTTASVLTLRGAWDTAFSPRLVGLLGLTLPVGTLITLAFRRAQDAGYTYLAGQASQRVVQLPDGSRCAWFLLANGADPVIGIEYRIANDVDGVATIAAGAVVDVGEAWVGPTVELAHGADWSESETDPSTVRRSKGSQVFVAEQPAYRSWHGPLVLANVAKVRGGGLAGGADWGTLRAACHGNGRVAAVPRFDSISELHRTALFGRATWDATQHLNGPLHSGGLTVDEIPASPA